MTRFNAMNKILNFGKQEEKQLLKQGKEHDAYQIEHTRNTLIYFLNQNPIKKVEKMIEKMISDEIDDSNFLCYVADELTRNLLVELKKEFANK